MNGIGRRPGCGIGVLAAGLALFGGGSLGAQTEEAAAEAQQTRGHRVLAADKGRIHLFDEAGESVWSYPIQGLHDLHRLDDGHVLAQRHLAEVIEIAPAAEAGAEPSGEIVWRYDARADGAEDAVEIHAFQRLPNGRTMVAESGRARILEVGSDGAILHQIPLRVKHPHPHRDTRLVRHVEGGRYLVCHEGDGAVREYDRDGTVVWEYEVPLFGRERKGGHGPEAFGNHVFGAIRRANGNTLVATGNGHSVLEVTPEKEIVWKLEQDELPGIRLAWVTTLQELPNGHLVVGNCHAGEGQPQIVELSRDKRVVWTFHDWEHLGNSVSNSLVLDAAGRVPGRR